MSRLPPNHRVVVDDGPDFDLSMISVGVPFEERSRQPEESSSDSPRSGSQPATSLSSYGSPGEAYTSRKPLYPPPSDIASCLNDGVDEIFEKHKMPKSQIIGRLANHQLSSLMSETEFIPDRKHPRSRRGSLNSTCESYTPRSDGFRDAMGERGPSWTTSTRRRSPRHNEASEYGRSDRTLKSCSRSRCESPRSSGSFRGNRPAQDQFRPYDSFPNDRALHMDHQDYDYYKRQEDIARSCSAFLTPEEFRYQMLAKEGVDDCHWLSRRSSDLREYGEATRRPSLPREVAGDDHYAPEQPLRHLRHEKSFQRERDELYYDHNTVPRFHGNDIEWSSREVYYDHNDLDRIAGNERSNEGSYDEDQVTCKMVEVTPGNFVPLRGSAETLEAVHLGRTRGVTCLVCQLRLVCVDGADMVICPQCKSISPVEGGSSGGGLGLGLREELAKNEVKDRNW